MRSLPPLNSLRAFEAAARHESFVKAAEELFVTPAAVSQQVKSLEAWLNVALFQRQPRGLSLTPAGRLYLPRLTETLDRLAEATSAVRRLSQTNVLTVGVTPGFASLWLGPRLWSFANRYPQLDIRVVASGKAVEFDDGSVDVAIRFSVREVPGLRTELLLKDGLTPVCVPELLSGAQPLREPRDLRLHTLLHNETQVLAGFRGSWQDWLERAGANEVDGRRGLYFSDFPLVLQETLSGRGVSLGHLALVAEHLRTGRLVRPFDLVMETGGDYYIVYPPGADQLPKVAAFLRWLRGQVVPAVPARD